MGLHHAKLKAAVAKYSALAEKPEEEVKADITADEKGFTPEEVDEIYAAVIAVPDPEGDKPKENKAPKAKKVKAYKVAEGKSFRDKDNFAKEYSEGDSLDGFDQDRIDHLLSIGYIEEA